MSGLRRVIVGASGSPGNLCALRTPNTLPAPPAPRWYPFMPGSRRAATSPTGDAPVSACAASGPKMPGSGCEKRSKLPGAALGWADHRAGRGARRARRRPYLHREPGGRRPRRRGRPPRRMGRQGSSGTSRPGRDREGPGLSSPPPRPGREAGDAGQRWSWRGAGPGSRRRLAGGAASPSSPGTPGI